ncbi:hypothetical protein SAMN05216446_1705 [Parafannyhessea umbonata]|uniref:CAAX prenyl protease 2/Lysostaphin resistance protein A-like domain-containing protein n=1 Tax=Parafannyhessea umbonata TaxID=604330 RepID=A0A1H9R514_9ACTN|nr:hypothetical protein SAMN05216446_1705 [Parafannyhessea umbonata]
MGVANEASCGFASGRGAKGYLARNAAPLLALALFVGLVPLVGRGVTYLNLAFYAVVTVYFAALGSCSPVRWKEELAKGSFWRQTLATVGAVVAGFLLMLLLQASLPGLDLGEIELPTRTPVEIALFALQTTLLPPLAEELFFRKSLIVLGGGARTVVTVVLSSLLFALEHALAPFGVLTYAVLGASFSIPYAWHKNVYAMMTAHLIVNVVGNGLPLAAMLLLAR